MQALEAFGCAPEVIEEARQAIKAQADAVDFLVWPENWHAVMLFLGMRTQWRWVIGAAAAARTGLDYSALPSVRPAVLQLVPPERRQPWPELLPQLQVMECAVLEDDA